MIAEQLKDKDIALKILKSIAKNINTDKDYNFSFGVEMHTNALRCIGLKNIEIDGVIFEFRKPASRV